MAIFVPVNLRPKWYFREEEKTVLPGLTIDNGDDGVLS
jgi:hypothetical protein